MKIVFNRNTHDENNKYRGETYFGIPEPRVKPDNMSIQEYDKYYHKVLEKQKEFERHQLFFGPHNLTKSDMTLEEIFKETQNLLYGGALHGKFDPKDPRLTIEGHLKSLAFMIEHKLVKAEIRVN